MDFHLLVFASVVGTVAWAYGIFRVLLSLDNLYRFLLLITAQYVVVKIYRVVIYPHLLSPLRHIPGPKDNHPFVGQFIKIFLDPSPIGLYQKWHSQWPRAPFIRYLGLFNKETLLINTPEAHKEVLQTHCYSFVKPSQLYRLVGEIIGFGLLFSEGDVHKRQRRMLSPLFTPSALKKIIPVFQDSTERMLRFFEAQLDANGTVIIDTVDTFSKLALEIAGKTLMGVDLNNLANPRSDHNFHSSYQRMLHPSRLSALIVVLNTAIPVRKWIPLEANTGYVRATQDLRRMVRLVVEERVQLYRECKQRGVVFESPTLRGVGRDILTLMVEEGAAGKGDDGLGVEEMVDQMLTLLTGGHETSATTLTWCMYALATRQEMQERLRDELSRIERGAGGRFEYWAGVEKLPYLHNFLREVLRRWAPVVLTYREPVEDMTICGAFIPKGTLIAFNFSQVNLCREIWGNDAEEFRPERWDSLSGEAASPYAFETFSNGPRICVGKSFAFTEIKCVLAEILTRFRVLPTPEVARYGVEGPPLQNPSITMTPEGGMKVVLERLGSE